MDNPTRYQFGPYEFDSEHGELRRNGMRQKISRQPALALHALLEARGELVTRENLANRIWSSDGHIEYEDRLNHVIKRVRDALRDSADHPQYLLTESGRGYRFDAPVTVVSSTGSPSASRWPRVYGAAAAVILLAVAVAFVTAGSQPSVSTVRPELAVVPISSMSRGAEMVRWADALGADLATALAASEAVTVNVNPDSAKDGTRFMVHGSLVSERSPHRIAVRLVDRSEQKILWSQVIEQQNSSLDEFRKRTIDLTLSAVFDRLLPSEVHRVASLQAYSSEATNSYNEALALLNEGRTSVALEHYDILLEEEPAHALAHADVARALLHRGWFTPNLARDVIPMARLSALKALALDGALAQPYLVLANIKAFHDWDWEAAEELYQKALQRNPNYAPTYLDYAGYLLVLGRRAEALEMMRTADAVDPLSANTQGLVGVLFHYLREYDRAHLHFDNALAIQPDHTFHTAVKACTYIFQGELAQARRFIDQARSRMPDEDTLKIVDAYLLIVVGQRPEAESLIASVNLEGLSSMSEMMSVSVFAALNRTDEAVTMLEKAYDARLVALPFSLVHPAYDGIRDDPRYLKIVQRMGLRTELAQLAP